MDIFEKLILTVIGLVLILGIANAVIRDRQPSFELQKTIGFAQK